MAHLRGVKKYTGPGCIGGMGKDLLKIEECSWNARFSLPVGPYQNCNELPSPGELVCSKNQVMVVGIHHQCCILPPGPLC